MTPLGKLSPQLAAVHAAALFGVKPRRVRSSRGCARSALGTTAYVALCGRDCLPAFLLTLAAGALWGSGGGCSSR